MGEIQLLDFLLPVLTQVDLFEELQSVFLEEVISDSLTKFFVLSFAVV